MKGPPKPPSLAKAVLQAQLDALRNQNTYVLELRFSHHSHLESVRKGFMRAGMGDLSRGALRLASDFRFRTPANLLELRAQPFWKYPTGFLEAGEYLMKKYLKKKRSNDNYKRNLKARIEARKAQRKTK